MSTQPELEFKRDMDDNRNAVEIVTALREAGRFVRMDELSRVTGIHEREIRKLITEVIRPQGVRLISTSRGYRIDPTEREIDEYEQFMMDRLESAAMNIAAVLRKSPDSVLNKAKQRIATKELCKV